MLVNVYPRGDSILLYLNYCCSLGVQCKHIAAPSHGYFTPNSTRLQYPSSVTAACVTGYTLKEVTERILTCTTNGDWNGTHPGCQGKYLKQLSHKDL